MVDAVASSTMAVPDMPVSAPSLSWKSWTFPLGSTSPRASVAMGGSEDGTPRRTRWASATWASIISGVFVFCLRMSRRFDRRVPEGCRRAVPRLCCPCPHGLQRVPPLQRHVAFDRRFLAAVQHGVEVCLLFEDCPVDEPLEVGFARSRSTRVSRSAASFSFSILAARFSSIMPQSAACSVTAAVAAG